MFLLFRDANLVVHKILLNGLIFIVVVVVVVVGSCFCRQSGALEMGKIPFYTLSILRSDVK